MGWAGGWVDGKGNEVVRVGRNGWFEVRIRYGRFGVQ